MRAVSRAVSSVVPTLRQLEYAVAVADEQSFSAAASHCHVSQPGLSAQISELERLLGVRLFERDRRGVIVTPIGEEVIEQARAVLGAARRLADIARKGARPLVGPLRLGVIPTIAPYLLPATLPRVRAKYPELRLAAPRREDRGAARAHRQGQARRRTAGARRAARRRRVGATLRRRVRAGDAGRSSAGQEKKCD